MTILYCALKATYSNGNEP